MGRQTSHPELAKTILEQIFLKGLTMAHIMRHYDLSKNFVYSIKHKKKYGAWQYDPATHSVIPYKQKTYNLAQKKHNKRIKKNENKTETERYLDSINPLNPDFIEWCSHLDIKIQYENGDSEEKKFSFDIWNEAQKEFEENRSKHKTHIICKTRQIGMSTLELLRDLWFAITYPKSFILIIAQDGRTKDEFKTDKIEYWIRQLQDKKKETGKNYIPNIQMNNANKIVFDNGSTLFFDSAKKTFKSAQEQGRGYTVDRLHASEVAFWRFGSVTMESLTPALRKAKEITVESTPNGEDGYFYDRVMKAKDKKLPDTHLSFYPWTFFKENKLMVKVGEEFDRNPRNEHEKDLIENHNITIHQLNWWRNLEKQYDKGIYSLIQEYPIDLISCFRNSSGHAFFDPEEIHYLISKIKHPFKTICANEFMDFENDDYKDDFVSIWEDPIPGKTYIMGVDVGYGRKLDPCVFYIIEQDSGLIVASYESVIAHTHDYSKIIYKVGMLYNCALVVVEAQGPGQAVISDLEKVFQYPNLWKSEKHNYYGFNTTGFSKPRLFTTIQKIVKEKEMDIYSDKVVQQIKLIELDGDSPDIPREKPNDHFMAFIIAQYIRSTSPLIGSFNPGFSNTVTNNKFDGSYRGAFSREFRDNNWRAI